MLTVSTAAQDAASNRLYEGLIGSWVGQLEYRDYTSNERVFLPTWLTVSASADQGSALLTYTYDDGPNKTLKEVSSLRFDTLANTATFGSDRDRSSETYKVEGLADFVKTGRGKLLLTGTDTEKGKKVGVRITMVVRRNLYTYVKETRPAGEDFQFRDAYTFTRRDPPI